MIYKMLLALYCCTLVTLQGITQPLAPKKPAIRIALVSGHVERNELTAIKQLLKSYKNSSFAVMDLDNIRVANSLKGFTHVWYHRTDTVSFDQKEIAAGISIKNFVKAGGNLFLSMESVGLLNSWGIETADFQLKTDSLIDDGFGRPAGFHAFKSHPLFAGLNGGVYSSKQKYDHAVRKHGFFNTSVPKIGKVVGVEWRYIKFAEQNKLLLEYKLGKGTIIAAGAYLYYTANNYNSEHLARFTENVFRYTAGQIKTEKKQYWNYQPRSISTASFTLPEVKPVSATKWTLPTPTLQLTKPVADKSFYNLVGRRILWMGTMNGGMDEIWMHPFMALKDFQFGVKTKGSDSLYLLKNIPAAIEVTPEYLVRVYRIKNTTLKEIYTVSFDQPNGVAHLEIEGDDLTELTLTYASNLRYMWPYSSESTGSIHHSFNTVLNGHIISGQQGALNTIVTYSAKPLQQKMWAEELLNQVKVQTEFSLKDKAALNIYITGSSESLTDAVQVYKKNAPNMNRLFERSNQYYGDVLDKHLYFETPDTLFNNCYKWALARTDQFLQTTPGIGTSLMAGFGTSKGGWNGNQKISGRPGYAWYFGRDAEWASMAVNAYGDVSMVKEVLETFIRFQDVNGKIYHELTSSGAVHYDASDATPLFVVLASHYLKYSGDVEYIRKRWPEFKKAMDFCYSTDTDKDGLIENTNVGHGWTEGGPLFGTHSEFYLTGLWAAALDAAAYITSHIGLKETAKYTADAEKVKNIIDRDYWNRNENFFHHGKMIDGSFMPTVNVLAAVPVYIGAVTDKNKAEKVSARFNNNYFSTSWGIRMVEDSSAIYSSGSYQDGTVRSLDGGWAALAEYRTGHFRSGYEHIMNSLVQYRQWSLGSIQEALNGEVYRPNGVCSNQAWSESMVLQPAIEGMLGMKPDAMANRLELAPYFPWDWKFCNVYNIRMKDAVLHLEMKRKTGLTTFNIDANKVVSLDFSPVFALNTRMLFIKINGKEVVAEVQVKPEGLSLPLSFTTKKGINTIEVQTTGGIGILPVMTMVQPGDSSTNMQILSEKVAGKIYTIEAAGRPGKEYELHVYGHDRIKNITGATLVRKEENSTILKLKMDTGNGLKYGSREIKIELE